MQCILPLSAQPRLLRPWPVTSEWCWWSWGRSDNVTMSRSQVSMLTLPVTQYLWRHDSKGKGKSVQMQGSWMHDSNKSKIKWIVVHWGFLLIMKKISVIKDLYYSRIILEYCFNDVRKWMWQQKCFNFYAIYSVNAPWIFSNIYKQTKLRL